MKTHSSQTTSVLRTNIDAMEPKRQELQQLTDQYLNQGNKITSISSDDNAWNRKNDLSAYNARQKEHAAKADKEYMEKWGHKVKLMLQDKTPIDMILEVTGIPYKTFLRVRTKLDM